jgi:hypothetical protein
VKKRSFLRLSDKIKISSAAFFDQLSRKDEGEKELTLLRYRVLITQSKLSKWRIEQYPNKSKVSGKIRICFGYLQDQISAIVIYLRIRRILRIPSSSHIR